MTICKLIKLYIFPLSFLWLTACQSSTSDIEQTNITSFSTENAVNNQIVVCQTARVSTFSLISITNGFISNPAKSRLNFRIGGTIDQIHVQNGVKVSVGQIIAHLDDRDQRLALRLAQDQIVESLVQLRALVAEYGGSDVDTNSLQPNTRAFILTKSGFYKAQTSLALAQQQLDYTTLKAPYSGTVANISTKPFNFITPYEPFCILLGHASLQVEFSVLETELDLIRIGMPVRISPLSIPGKVYSGQISELNPLVNSQGLVQVKARLNRPDGYLFEGMNVRIAVERKIPNQLVVPKSAVIERSGRKVVFVVEAGRAKWNFVTISHENETEVSISKGLNLRDEVIISGNLNLGNDAPVNVKKL